MTILTAYIHKPTVTADVFYFTAVKIASKQNHPHKTYRYDNQDNPNSREVVEYAVRLLGQDADSEVLLPIDAKSPKKI